MKQTIKSIIRTVKSVKGNSLAEFATTTALMATLAATAAPKLSEMSEGTKGEKSRNEIDKLIKQAGNFYQDTADSEGRGRFPGQSKFNKAVGGGDYDNSDASSMVLLQLQSCFRCPHGRYHGRLRFRSKVMVGEIMMVHMLMNGYHALVHQMLMLHYQQV